MFNLESHFYIYQALEKAMQADDAERLLEILRIEMPGFCLHKDELRMFYYIIIRASEAIYRPILLFYKTMIRKNPDIYRPRLPHLVAALQNNAQFNPQLDISRIKDIQSLLPPAQANSASA